MARALVRGLRARGLDVSTTLEAGLLGEPDVVQLEYASAHNLVLFTFNVGDFCRLHGEYLKLEKDHSGIVVVPRQRYSIGQQIRGLSKLTAGSSAEEMVNCLVFLESGA